MPLIKDSCKEAIRQRVSLLEVAQQYTEMKRAGRQWRGLSPFSHEKTPSFFVNDEKGVFNDYSSGEKGDLFTFVMAKENLSFHEAIETLARRYGVTLEYEEGSGPSDEAVSLRKELYEINECATDYFHTCFNADHPHAEAIRDYWASGRGFSMEVARDWRIGFAPQDGGKLFELLRKHGFSDESLRQCSLFHINEHDADRLRRPFPFFRGRLMIPIRDLQGRVVAFTARQTEFTPQGGSGEAKYVNSSETPVFKKGDLLFNLDRAKIGVRQSNRFVLVEGQLDAIRCDVAGIPAAVAPQGTAITPEQISLLKRYTRNLDVVLDGDGAGKRAAFRTLEMALKAGLEPRFLTLDPGQDPDDLLREGGLAAFEALHASALTPMAMALATVLPDRAAATPREVSTALHGLYRLLADLDSAVARDGYLTELAELAKIDPGTLRADAERVFRAPRRPARPATGNTAHPGTPAGTSADGAVDGAAGATSEAATAGRGSFFSAEEETLTLLLNHPALTKQTPAQFDFEWVIGDSRAAKYLRRVLLEAAEGEWEGLDAFLETVEDAGDRAYLVSLAESGPTLLDQKLRLTYKTTVAADEDATPTLLWTHAGEALAETLQRLLNKYIEREKRRTGERLMTCANDPAARSAAMAERAQLRELTKKAPSLFVFE